MFYVVTLERQVDVEPRMFGPQLEAQVKEKVRREAQGTVDPSVGYIIHVKQVDLLGKGLIRSDGSGLATFNVQYACICMRLWPDEVVDAEVEQVTAYGIRCKVGPFRIFVSEKTAVRSLVQNMPDDFLLRNINNQDVWVSETPNEILEIKEDSHVRIRVANVQLQPEKLVFLAECGFNDGGAVQGGVATLKGDYLGVLAC